MMVEDVHVVQPQAMEAGDAPDESTEFADDDFRNTVPRFSEENRKANRALIDRIKLTETDLHEIEEAASQIEIQGARYPESSQQRADR